MKKTILYITSSREDEAFESKIREKILEVKGEHDLISVSQKPIDFGQNICVGDVGQSYQNALYQMLTGALNAQTEYIALAESDQLYPPDYFNFEPDGQDVYMYNNLWLLKWWDKHFYYHKPYGDWLAVVKTKYLIKRLKSKLGGRTWGNEIRIGRLFYQYHRVYFGGDPVITIKTTRQVNGRSGFTTRNEYTESTKPRTSLPYWGTAVNIYNEFNLDSNYQTQ